MQRLGQVVLVMLPLPRRLASGCGVPLCRARAESSMLCQKIWKERPLVAHRARLVQTYLRRHVNLYRGNEFVFYVNVIDEAL